MAPKRKRTVSRENTAAESVSASSSQPPEKRPKADTAYYGYVDHNLAAVVDICSQKPIVDYGDVKHRVYNAPVLTAQLIATIPSTSELAAGREDNVEDLINGALHAEFMGLSAAIVMGVVTHARQLKGYTCAMEYDRVEFKRAAPSVSLAVDDIATRAFKEWFTKVVRAKGWGIRWGQFSVTVVYGEDGSDKKTSLVRSVEEIRDALSSIDNTLDSVATAVKDLE